MWPTEVRAIALPVEGDTDDEWEAIRRRGAETPDGPWQFVLDRLYAIRLELRADGLPLHIPPNFRIAEDLGGETLRVVRRSPNSAVLLMRAERLGRGVVQYRKASMEGEETLALPSLEFRREFEVVEPLAIAAPFDGPLSRDLVLPPWHSWALRVRGGSGAYEFWAEGSVCEVSASGVVRAKGRTGDAAVLVRDVRNSANNATIRVLVLSPGGLLLKPPQVQVLAGTAGLVVPVWALAEDLVCVCVCVGTHAGKAAHSLGFIW